MIEAGAIWVFAALRYLKFELNLNQKHLFRRGGRNSNLRLSAWQADTLTNWATTASLKLVGDGGVEPPTANILLVRQVLYQLS